MGKSSFMSYDILANYKGGINMTGFASGFGEYGYAIILVLFILLVIIGCACC